MMYGVQLFHYYSFISNYIKACISTEDLVLQPVHKDVICEIIWSMFEKVTEKKKIIDALSHVQVGSRPLVFTPHDKVNNNFKMELWQN